MYIDDYIPHCIQFEGSVRWMYLDTRGLVTVGVGKMLPNTGTACGLPFHGPNGLAFPDEVISDYRRVQTMPPGLKPGAYFVEGCCMLSDQDVRNLLAKTLQEFDLQLHEIFHSFDEFPEPSKIGLLDLIFNLGPNKLSKQYVHLNAAVNRQDWITASKECYREGPSQYRNDWCKQQFLPSVG